MPPKLKRKPVVPVTATLEELDQHIIDLANLRKQKGMVEDKIAEKQQDILDTMTAHGVKTYEVIDSTGLQHKAAMQQNVSRSIDETKLKRKVGPGIWRRITTLALDRKKVDALVADGTIDPVDLADCVTETPSKQFVKVSTK